MHLHFSLTVPNGTKVKENRKILKISPGLKIIQRASPRGLFPGAREGGYYYTGGNFAW